MGKKTDITNIENDNLICPITLQPFLDPVVAEDGHTYEREAIARWILEKGTSPITREPLKISNFQSDDYLRRLAARQRNSTVSCSMRNSCVRLSFLRRIGINNLSASQIICFMIFCFGIVAVVISVIMIVRIKSSKSYSTSTVTFEPAIMSNYSSSLTNNLVFIRPWSKNNPSYYKAIQFFVSTNGFYSFKSVSNIDLYGCLYTGYFNSTNPYINLRTCADNSGDNQQFYFIISLLSGNYTLVATTYFGNVIGNFSIIVYGAASVAFQ